MFIISPFDRKDFHNDMPLFLRDSSDRKWKPTSTEKNPEKVILSRMCALAKLSYNTLILSLMNENDHQDWEFVFQESPSSIRSYNVLLKVCPDIIIDKGCSSSGGSFSILMGKDGGYESPFTKSLKKRFLGPKQLTMKLYRNLTATSTNNILVSRYFHFEVTIFLLIPYPHVFEFGYFFLNSMDFSLLMNLWQI